MPDAARTAIIAAIQQELQGVLAAVPGAQSRTIGGQQFWFGRWHGHELALATSGMGKVAAAQAATLLAACCGARRVLLAGTAGALDAGLNVGDAVVARAFVQHDMDASPLFPRFEVPLTGRSRYATDAALADALFVEDEDFTTVMLFKSSGAPSHFDSMMSMTPPFTSLSTALVMAPCSSVFFSATATQ